MAKFKNEITLSKSKVTIDFSSELKSYKGTQGQKKKLLQSLGSQLKKEIKSWSKNEISPVTGKAWKKLSKGYKNFKKSIVGNGKANLVLKNKMLESIEFSSNANKNTLTLTIKGNDKESRTQKKKSFNHNQRKSKAAPLPMRRFLPTAKSDKFNTSIMRGLKDTIKQAKEEV